MDKIHNPYFSVELSEVQLNNLRERTRSILAKNLELEFQELDNPHISVSYVLGDVSLKTIAEVADEIVEAPFKMSLVGFKAIESGYYGGTIISIGLNHTDDFLYSQEYLKEVFCQENPDIKIKEYSGGFQAHISLFVIKSLSESDKENLPRYLELCLTDLGGIEVSGERFCMYNPEREKILERKFK